MNSVWSNYNRLMKKKDKIERVDRKSLNNFHW